MTLPDDFTAYTRQLMGSALFSQLAEGLCQEPQVSIRLNPFKTAGHDVQLSAEATPVPWCRGGYYLTERPQFTFDPLLHAGVYYVQEASSMFLGHVLRHLVKEPVTMLDLCAAPGGKSTCARAALPEGSMLYSNEPIRQRAQILNENILKFGHPDVIVTNAYAEDYRKAGLTFDVILTDVPCSGEGMFRKDEGAIREWSTSNVDRCARLQREIVETIWPCLRPGGLLIYSTCTFNAHENEENAAWIADELGADFVEIPIESNWGITGPLVGTNPAYRFLPGISRGEGLFMTVLRKKDESTSQKDGKRALPTAKILSHGPLPDILKGKKAIPDASQALTIAPPPFPIVPLTYAESLSYLQGQSIVLPASAPRGIVAVAYQGHALGLMKNLGNRANNLHPQPWRIHTTHLPEQETTIIQL